MKIIDDIEQNTPEWFAERDGNITGTTKVTAFTGKKMLVDYWRLLAYRLVTPKPEDGDFETERDRGLRLEDEAAELAAKDLGVKLYKDVALCVSDEDPRLMYSPDKLIEPYKGKFMADMEIKCFEGAAHLESVIDGYIPDKTQMLRPFTINPDLMIRYYVFYHDRIIAPKLRLKIMEITREDYEVEIAQLAERDQAALTKIDEIVEKYTF